jgi:hypothetical protein
VHSIRNGCSSRSCALSDHPPEISKFLLLKQAYETRAQSLLCDQAMACAEGRLRSLLSRLSPIDLTA